jgi:hypothetical protein
MRFGRTGIVLATPKTGKESSVYGRNCSERVPFRYLFSAKPTGNRPTVAVIVGTIACRAGRGERQPGFAHRAGRWAGTGGSSNSANWS